MTNSEEAALADGVGAYAVTFFEMGDAPELVREKLLTQWRQLGEPTGLFHAAAKAISGFPQPVLESVETTERSRAMRERLGVQSPEDQLLAALRAREVLDNLGNELG